MGAILSNDGFGSRPGRAIIRLAGSRRLGDCVPRRASVSSIAVACIPVCQMLIGVISTRKGLGEIQGCLELEGRSRNEIVKWKLDVLLRPWMMLAYFVKTNLTPGVCAQKKNMKSRGRVPILSSSKLRPTQISSTIDLGAARMHPGLLARMWH